MPVRLPISCFFGSLLLCVSTPLLPASAAGNLATIAPPVQTLIERYSADHDTLASVYTDQLSPTTRDRMTRFLADQRRQLTAIDFNTLDQEGKVDYLLLSNHLTREEHSLALTGAQWKEVAPLLPIAATIFTL